jgi:pilus assembly protein Flp/PilA
MPGENLMTKPFATLKKFVQSEDGASLAEYGLLLALIAVICIAGMQLLGTTISSMFTNVSGTI